MGSVTQQALVFMSAAVILVPIFKKLGFGTVLGYLIAGMVVGPFGLGFIKESESIVHFSEFGVIFLLFIIGLEIQPRKLMAMKKHLLGLGGLQIASCSLIFFLLGLGFGISPIASLAIGFSLSLSSTAFAMQTLMEKSQFNTEHGRASFSILLMQDLVAIPALALIPLIGTQSQAGQNQPQVLLALTTIALLIFASRYLIGPLFRYIAMTRSRDLFTAITLFIVVGVSLLMQSLGLSAALGSFIAGVLLADSEYRHELEADIEPFKGLLMGLFFIAVGMGVNLSIIASNPFLIFALTLGYLLIKSIAIYSVGRIFSLGHFNSKQMSLNIAQGGEFAFVILAIIAGQNVTSSENIGILVAIITLSMALNPLFSILDEKVLIRFKPTIQKQFDEIKDESPQIIIAGFGRFGQIFGRILRAQGIPFVAIDHDSDQIELLRKFGSRVYFGDATRAELLEAAGAAKAKYFVLAIDDVELSLQAAKMVREHFPHLKIFARARNRGHAFELLDLGIEHIKRETFDSSLFFTYDLLIDLGITPENANRIVQKFKQHDEIMLLEQYKVRTDDKSLVAVSRQGTQQLAQVLNDDNQRSHIAVSEDNKKS